MLASIYRAAIPKCFFYDFMTFLLISMTFWGIVLILCHVAEKWGGGGGGGGWPCLVNTYA